MRADAIKDLREERVAFFGRIVFAGFACVIAAVALMLRLGDLQLLQYSYYSTRADDNRMRLTPVPPVRGLLYDRNGALLAQNQPAFVLQLTPERVENLELTMARLSQLVAIDDRDIARFRERARKSPRYQGVPLRTNLSLEEVARYEINRYDFKGVEVTAGLARNYPLGSTAAHLIGYVGGITEDDLKRLDPLDYQGLSQIGKTGIEKSQENWLRGSPGAKIIEANAHGRPLRELDYRLGAPGRNLYLTIDARLQQTAETALGELSGAVVAIDPRNGEVLALVSKPGFDPHLFVEGIDQESYNTLTGDRKRPLFNRALAGQYPPGSVIKPAMALAGLEYGVVDPSNSVYCRGEMTLPGSTRRYRCWRRTGHGWMDMVQGVMHSCDVYFYELALKLGIDRIFASMTDFGLGELTGIDLPLEKRGLMPSREWKQRVRREGWYPGETLNTGIGQGYMMTTPMQLAQMTARIAMRGGGFRPQIVHAIEDALTQRQSLLQPQPLQPIVLKDNRNWDRVVRAMEMTAHEPGGTAYRIGRDAPYRIAAKTGTAQVAAMRQDEEKARHISQVPEHLRDHALFIAFAPVDDPRIAIAVLAEHAGSGGAAAAPIARQVMDMALLGEVRYVPPPPAPDPPPRAPAAPAAPAAGTGPQAVPPAGAVQEAEEPDSD
jgi:penicillin-binding protein 2